MQIFLRLDLFLAQIFPDGESHGGQPGPGAGHVSHDGPSVGLRVVALDGVVVSVPALLPAQHEHLPAQCGLREGT